MFLSKSGEYKASGIYNVKHYIVVLITLLCVFIAIRYTKDKKKQEIKKIIQICTIVMWIFEVIIISFKLTQCSLYEVNMYVPLYYCSLLLYAGLLSSFAKGRLKRAGDVFLSTGGIIGGVVYLIFPTTSLPAYPLWHLITLHSFIFHGIMIYLGLIINITHYIELQKSDILYYSGMVGIICILALIINNIFGSNLMFISQNFPGMPLEIIYNLTGKFFTLVMCFVQMTLPFFMIFYIKNIITVKARYLK